MDMHQDRFHGARASLFQVPYRVMRTCGIRDSTHSDCELTEGIEPSLSATTWRSKGTGGWLAATPIVRDGSKSDIQRFPERNGRLRPAPP